MTMTAGVARKPGMTRDDLFDINAGIVKGTFSPHAFGLIVSRSTVATAGTDSPALSSTVRWLMQG